MVLELFLLIAGLALLTLGAEGLVRSGASIALKLGVTPLVVGLTIVSIGTSSPELVVSAEAAYFGNSAIALGNVIGSNISNTALILGIAALIYPIKAKAQVVKRELPIMVFVSAVLWLMLIDGVISRFEGVVLLGSCVVYIFLLYFLAGIERKKEIDEEFAEAVVQPPRRSWVDATFLVGGIALLVAGAKLLIDGAISLAARVEIPEVVVGLTVVAIGTSLPELATSAVAAFKEEPDLALGNAIGSNIANILCILGVTAIINPISAEGLRTLDLAVMLGSAAFLWAILGYRFALNRIEAVVLLAGYFLYIYTLVP